MPLMRMYSIRRELSESDHGLTMHPQPAFDSDLRLLLPAVVDGAKPPLARLKRLASSEVA